MPKGAALIPAARTGQLGRAEDSYRYFQISCVVPSRAQNAIIRNIPKATGVFANLCSRTPAQYPSVMGTANGSA